MIDPAIKILVFEDRMFASSKEGPLQKNLDSWFNLGVNNVVAVRNEGDAIAELKGRDTPGTYLAERSGQPRFNLILTCEHMPADVLGFIGKVQGLPKMNVPPIVLAVDHLESQIAADATARGVTVVHQPMSGPRLRSAIESAALPRARSSMSAERLREAAFKTQVRTQFPHASEELVEKIYLQLKRAEIDHAPNEPRNAKVAAP